MKEKNMTMLNASQVAKMLGVSGTKFWRSRKAKTFPKPIKMAGGYNWPQYKVEEWVEEEFEKAQK
ncbi:helix-turn-helix transcriptional regulator [Vibrio breoganii]